MENPKNRTEQEAAIMLRLAKEGVHPSDIDRRTAEEVAAQTKAHVALVFGSAVVDSVKPFKVRASCGHIVIRKMREATAGVPYTAETVLEAPNGRACPSCEAGPLVQGGM